MILLAIFIYNIIYIYTYIYINYYISMNISYITVAFGLRKKDRQQTIHSPSVFGISSLWHLRLNKSGVSASNLVGSMDQFSRENLNRKTSIFPLNLGLSG
jgi:hypothetical protein